MPFPLPELVGEYGGIKCGEGGEEAGEVAADETGE
jgi:hypothetical protein